MLSRCLLRDNHSTWPRTAQKLLNRSHSVELPLCFNVKERHKRKRIFDALHAQQKFRRNRSSVAECTPGNERNAIGRQSDSILHHRARLDRYNLTHTIIGHRHGILRRECRAELLDFDCVVVKVKTGAEINQELLRLIVRIKLERHFIHIPGTQPHMSASVVISSLRHKLNDAMAHNANSNLVRPVIHLRLICRDKSCQSAYFERWLGPLRRQIAHWRTERSIFPECIRLTVDDFNGGASLEFLKKETSKIFHVFPHLLSPFLLCAVRRNVISSHRFHRKR